MELSGHRESSLARPTLWSVIPLKRSQFDYDATNACVVIACLACCYFLHVCYKIGYIPCSVGDYCYGEPNLKNLEKVLEKGSKMWLRREKKNKRNKLPLSLDPFQVITMYFRRKFEALATSCEKSCLISRSPIKERACVDSAIMSSLEIIDLISEINSTCTEPTDFDPNEEYDPNENNLVRLHQPVCTIWIKGDSCFTLMVDSNDKAWIFDSHRRDKNTGALTSHKGNAVLIQFDRTEDILDFLELKYGTFTIKSVEETGVSIEEQINKEMISVYFMSSLGLEEPKPDNENHEMFI